MNNIQKRLHFRRGLYRTLEEAEEPVELIEVGQEIFDLLKREDAMPSYSKSSGDLEFSVGSSRAEDDAFKEYLLFNAVMELGTSPRRNQQNLEDVGRLMVPYRLLDRLAGKKDLWSDVPEFLDLSQEAQEDYLTGFLDLMRYRTHFRPRPLH